MLEDKEVIEGGASDKVEEEFDIVEANPADKTAVTDDQEDEDDDQDDQSLASGGPVDKSERTETNAQKRKKRKRALKEKLDQKDALLRSVQQQNKQLAERLALQERRSGQHEKAFVDKATNDAKLSLEATKQSYAQALTTGDPNAVADALDLHYAAKRRVEELENIQRQVASSPQVTGSQTLDNNVVRNTNSWMSHNPWFRPEGGDRDSKIAKVIDDEIAEEGFDPRTQEYWRELDRRLKDALPHRVRGGRQEAIDDEDDDSAEDTRQTQQRQQPRQTVGSSGQSSGSSRKKITLSPARIQAIKDAGAWDNPVKRNAMVKEYLRWDRENVN